MPSAFRELAQPPASRNILSFFSDHERGQLLFRGYSLEQLWEADFEDMLHLLVLGTYPSTEQRTGLSVKLARYMELVPRSVHEAIQILP